MEFKLLLPEGTNKYADDVEKRNREHIRNKKRLAKKEKKELPDFLSVKELASYLGVNTNTVYGAIKKGKIPGAKKIGGRILIHRLTFESWFTSCSGGHHGD